LKKRWRNSENLNFKLLLTRYSVKNRKKRRGRRERKGEKRG